MLSSLYTAAFPNCPSFNGKVNEFIGADEINDFTYTQINSGTATIIPTNDVAAGGVIQFSSVGATDDKGAQIQDDNEWIQPVNGITLYCIHKFQISDATQADWLAGVAITDTSLIASAPSDGIYFYKPDGSAIVSLLVQTGSVNIVTIPAATIVAATNIVLAYSVAYGAAGAGTIVVYVNGTEVSRSTVAGLPTAEAMARSVAMQSGEAALKTANLYMLGAWMTYQ